MIALVIDDREIEHLLLQLRLRDRCKTILRADDWGAALEALRSIQVDVVVSDLWVDLDPDDNERGLAEVKVAADRTGARMCLRTGDQSGIAKEAAAALEIPWVRKSTDDEELLQWMFGDDTKGSLPAAS